MIFDNLSAWQLNVGTAVADAEVKLSIWPDTQPVQIVADEPHPHTVPVVQRPFAFRRAIAVLVLEQPQMRNVSKINRPLSRQHAGADAVRQTTKTIRKNRRFIRAP